MAEKYEITYQFDKRTNEILRNFIETKRLEGCSEATLNQYHREIKLCLNYLQKPIGQVTTLGIKQYLNAMKSQHSLQNSTLENMRQYLNAVFSWAVNEEYITSNPIKRVTKIRCEQKVRPSFSGEELTKIKDYCKNNKRNFALVNFLYATGCRVSECCSVDIDDINFNDYELIVNGKGNKQRVVFLDEAAVAAIQDYLSTRSDDEKALFISVRKTRITDSGVRYVLKQIERNTGVKNIHPHRFRRTLATDLLDAGMPIQDVAFILGHANIRTTQKYNYQTVGKVKEEFKKYFNINEKREDI